MPCDPIEIPHFELGDSVIIINAENRDVQGVWWHGKKRGDATRVVAERSNTQRRSYRPQKRRIKGRHWPRARKGFVRVTDLFIGREFGRPVPKGVLL